MIMDRSFKIGKYLHNNNCDSWMEQNENKDSYPNDILSSVDFH